MNKLTTAWKLLTTRDQTKVELVGNLFGSISRGKLPLGSNWDFVPINNEGGIMSLNGDGGVSAQWLGLSSRSLQYWAYNYCSPLAAVIDKLAEADTNGIVEFLNSDGTTVKNINNIPKLKRIRNLLLNPNPNQTFEEWNSEQILYCKIFGYCPVFAVGNSLLDNSYRSKLYNLDPLNCTPEFNYEYSMFAGDDEPKKQNPIKLWRITILGKQYEIQPEDIMLVKDGYLNKTGEFGLPLSKVAGLDYFVSNICAAMEADNVLLKKKGPLGVFTHAAKPDLAGTALPMKPGDKDDLQNDLDNYGLGWFQKQYVISKNPIKWEAMSFNLRDLMTKETVRQAIDGICDRFGYPAELMSGKNATYENRDSAEKFLYQNNIIPFSLRRMARFCKFFGLDGEYKITLDYDHLPVLQEDIMHAGQAFEALSAGLDLMWKAGILTFNQVLVRLEQDTVSGMDIYYPEWLKANPEMREVKTENKPKNEKKPKDK